MYLLVRTLSISHLLFLFLKHIKDGLHIKCCALFVFAFDYKRAAAVKMGGCRTGGRVVGPPRNVALRAKELRIGHVCIGATGAQHSRRWGRSG